MHPVRTLQPLENDNGAQQITILYTARKTFDNTYGEDALSWNKYIDWSKLTHLTELVSVDRILNKKLVERDYDNPGNWTFIHTVGEYQNGFFHDR